MIERLQKPGGYAEIIALGHIRNDSRSRGIQRSFYVIVLNGNSSSTSSLKFTVGHGFLAKQLERYDNQSEWYFSSLM